MIPTRRIRVLYLIDAVADGAGGAERFAVGLALNLPPDEFEVTMCSTRFVEPEVAARLRAFGIGQLHLNRRSSYHLRPFSRLVSTIRRERFDVLHAHMFGSNLWGTLIGRATRIPVTIAHEHTWSYDGNRLRVWLDGRVIGRLATRFVAVSSEDARRMVEIERVPAGKVIVMPNAYVPHLSPPRPVDLRGELELGPDTPILMAVAVLRPQKALSVLLEAHSKLLAVDPNVHLVLVGDGPCRAELEALTDELRLRERVHFLGYRGDVDQLLRSAQVAALSSDYEGMPLVVFECMANMVPLVATAVGGLSDIIESGRNGVLVPARDPAALADAIARLLADPEQRRTLAAAAALKLPEFTIESTARRYGALYKELLAEA